MRLNQTVWGINSPEWILFGFASYECAGLTAFGPNNSIENENEHSALLALDYIPDLPESPA